MKYFPDDSHKGVTNSIQVASDGTASVEIPVGLIRPHHFGFGLVMALGAFSLYAKGQTTYSLYILLGGALVLMATVFARSFWTRELIFDPIRRTVSVVPRGSWLKVKILQIDRYSHIETSANRGKSTSFNMRLIGDRSSVTICVVEPVVTASSFFSFPLESEPDVLETIREYFFVFYRFVDRSAAHQKTNY